MQSTSSVLVSRAGGRRVAGIALGLVIVAVAAAWVPTLARAGTLATPVVGGKLVQPGEWPDVVAVLTEDGGLCSGTLLGADLVLTAGHCIGGHPVEVIIGSVDILEPHGQRRAVKWSKAYPNWESRYDVGIVMLENPVLVKQRAIAERCVSGTRDRLATGSRLEVVGFGLTTKSATDSNTRLHAASIAVVDGQCTRDSSCMTAVAPGGEFIAGGAGADACFGDSGGPVYVATSRGPALIGVVSRGLASWTQPCGEGGVFVRADRVVDWIEEVTGRRVDRVECDLPADAGGDTDDHASEADGDEVDAGADVEPAAGCSAARSDGLALPCALFAAVMAAFTCASRRRRLAPR